jgi:succinoglycan biosynthesis protein ExoO
MPNVSVIVPVFNAADFVDAAYRSLLGQTSDDWEALFVNDGSQDGTLGVVQSIAISDKRVKVIDLPTNCGPAYARNAALAVAEGQWIAVLDADDAYSPDRLEVLTRAGEETRADVVLDNQFVIDPISKRVRSLAFEPTEDEPALLTFADYLRNTQSNTLFDFGYLKPLLRRHWMISHQIQYQEKLRLGEDLMLLWDCYACQARVTLVPKPHYHYYFQYSPAGRRKSPTSRTDANYGPLLAAMDEFLEKHGPERSWLEQRLLMSAREALHETILVKAFKAYLERLDIIGGVSCLRHPIRLLRGAYFEKKRGISFRRRKKNLEGSRDERF